MIRCIAYAINNVCWDSVQKHRLPCTIQSQKGTRFESSMWKKIIFFLHIKKFLYTHEKDEYNDVNKHIFEKMYWN